MGFRDLGSRASLGFRVKFGVQGLVWDSGFEVSGLSKGAIKPEP